MRESSIARIPVRPLPYSDRDIAMTREIIIDYDKGNIYITDKDDPTILIDITKLIADSYLSNINGDNTSVTINGEVYNLSELLSELKKNKIEILNSADAISVPADVNYDHRSVTVDGVLVSIYGFMKAPNLSTPRKVDGQLVWDSPKGDDLEPTPGASDNVITVIPTNDHIVLYAKPGVYTHLTAALEPLYHIEMPTSQPRYAHFAWRLDSEVISTIKFPANIEWVTTEVASIIAKRSYIFNIETWDYGVTWIISHIEFDIS